VEGVGAEQGGRVAKAREIGGWGGGSEGEWGVGKWWGVGRGAPRVCKGGKKKKKKGCVGEARDERTSRRGRGGERHGV